MAGGMKPKVTHLSQVPRGTVQGERGPGMGHFFKFVCSGSLPERWLQLPFLISFVCHMEESLLAFYLFGIILHIFSGPPMV